MKSLLACALLVLVPFSSLRMVCFDPHDAAGSAHPTTTADAAWAEAAAEPKSECERICMRRPAAPPRAQTTTCVLVADPSCTFFDTASAAILPRDPMVPAVLTTGRLEPIAIDDYLSPVIARGGPPPRS